MSGDHLITRPGRTGEQRSPASDAADRAAAAHISTAPPQSHTRPGFKLQAQPTDTAATTSTASEDAEHPRSTDIPAAGGVNTPDRAGTDNDHPDHGDSDQPHAEPDLTPDSAKDDGAWTDGISDEALAERAQRLFAYVADEPPGWVKCSAVEAWNSPEVQEYLLDLLKANVEQLDALVITREGEESILVMPSERDPDSQEPSPLQRLGIELIGEMATSILDAHLGIPLFSLLSLPKNATQAVFYAGTLDGIVRKRLGG